MRAARRLLGLNLDGGWKVVREVPLNTITTGGRYSAGYIVENNEGNRAFLKALDYSSATLPGRDTPLELKRMTTEFVFERDLVTRCAGRGFSRIVKGIGHGKVQVAPGLDGQVEYLLFELADGDIRKQLMDAAAIGESWRLRVLHHVATALFQLHTKLIAHQDLKPSNVLTFGDEGAKLGDLGRAAALGSDPPHNEYPIAGDPTYAPPELLYKQISADWKERRIGCDLYHLGSLASFLFSSANMTALLLSELPSDHSPSTWGGTFDEAMPQLQHAFSRALARVSPTIPEMVRTDLLNAIRELCEPDPKRRGHRKALASVHDRYNCERYISLFNLLATRMEVKGSTAT